MKKSLLLGVVLCIGIAASAQHRDFTKLYKAEVRPIDYGRGYLDINPSVQNENTSAGLLNGSRDILKTQISSSSNVFGIFSQDQTVLTTDPDLDFVVFGNRAGGPMGATGNDLRICWSNDLGINWTNFIVTPGVDNKWFRYPSTTFYNPVGNTDPANMYAIFSGPYTNSAGWEGQYWGSVKFDGTTDKHITFEVNQPTVYINHMNIGLNVTPAGKVHVASQRLNGTASAYTSVGWEVLNGTFNTATNQVDWELPRVIVNPPLGDDNRIDASGMVYSPDGSVGYLLGTGIDTDEAYNSYGVEWPVVLKTVDDGETWEKIEPFDFSQIAIFSEMLYPTRANLDLVVPRWYNKYVGGNRNNGVTVDMDGNLHISGIVRSTMSINLDSLNYFYTLEPILVFDVFMNGDGTWDATFIDSLRTEVVPDTDPFGMGWDQRVQMSRSKDGSSVFTAWADTDPTLWGGGVTTNLQPDIYTWGWNLFTGSVSPAVNVTALGDYWGDNLWLHVGDKALVNGDEYHIPMTTSSPSTPGTNQDNPMNHYYVSGVSIMVSAKNLDVISKSDVSQNYPNPFKSQTQISLTLDKPADISLEVYNLVGQKVLSIPTRSYSAGTHTLDLNAGGLRDGVYIYSIIANGERVSRKMSIK